MKIISSAIAFFILSIFKSPGQENLVKTGDTLPDIIFNDVVFFNDMGYESRKLKLSDMKGKLVILDFWSMSCGSCVAGFPKMDALQKKFGKQIQILPINAGLVRIDVSIKKEIDSFWRSTPFSAKTSLATIIDTTFRNFPKTVAYQIWIDGNRVVRAITNDEYVNEKEIGSMLQGNWPDWEIATKKFYDGKNPFFEHNSDNKNIFRSSFSRYYPGLYAFGGVIDDKTSSNIRLTIVNQSIIDLYKQVFKPKISYCNVIVETNDSSKYFPNIYKNEWARKNAYCYEAIYSKNDNQVYIQQQVLRDLNIRLGVNARFENRIRPCWVLKQGGRKSKQDEVNKDDGYSYNNTSSLAQDIQSLLFSKTRAEMYEALPVINETHISGKIDVKLKTSNVTIEQIIKKLALQGFDLVKEDRLQEVFVISDIP